MAETKKRGNGHDKHTAQLDIRRQLSRLPAKQRMDAILSERDARGLVQSLPAEELFTAIAEIGLADASELVQLASPKQFQVFLDLGGWCKDKLDPHLVLTWLRAARGDEDDEFLKKLHGMDVEVLEHMLRQLIVVHDLEANPDIHPSNPTLETPDGKYLVELLLEGVEEYAMRNILAALFAENAFEAVRFLEATKWELPSELEEHAYRFRMARLQDLGFPSLDEAVALFSYVQLPEPSVPVGATATTALTATSGERTDFVEQGFRGLSEIERQNLEPEVRYLVNSVLVAEGAEPGRLEDIRRISELARDYLGLGLEHLSGGNPAHAPEVIRSHDLKHIFKVGFSLTLRLKLRADKIAKQPLAFFAEQYWMFPEESAAMVALRRNRPLRALRVEGAEPVAFRRKSELSETQRVLERAEAQAGIFCLLLGGAEDKAEQTLSRFPKDPVQTTPLSVFASWAAWAALDEQPKCAPVPAARLNELSALLFGGSPNDPSIRPGVTQQIQNVFEKTYTHAPVAEAQRMIVFVLEQLKNVLAPAYLRGSGWDPTVKMILPIEGWDKL